MPWLTLLACVLLLGACATPVSLPAGGDLAASHATAPALPPATGLGAREGKSIETVPVADYKAGSRNEFGVTIDAALAEAYVAFNRGEPEAALALLDRDAALRVQPEARWVADALRFESLLRLGRAADAEALAERMAVQERQINQATVASRSMRGMARYVLGRFDEALADLGQVAQAIGPWSLPVSYGGPPSNMFALMSFTAAQLRAYTGIASVYARQGDYRRAMDWAQAAEALYRDLYYVQTHPLYGSGTIPPEAAYGRAFNLATLGMTQLATRPDDPQAGAPLETARRFFAARQHAWGETVAQAYQALAALAAGRVQEASRLAEAGERLATERGLPDMVWQLALQRGEAELAQGGTAHTERAEAALRIAQASIDAVSGALASDDSRLRFGIGKDAVTRHLARLDRQRGDLDALFSDLERGRARAFVDLLHGLPLAQGRQTEAVARIRQLDADLRRQRLKNAVGVGQPLTRLLQARTEAVAELRRRDADLADARGVASVRLADVQARLGEGETLAYAIPDADDAPLAWLLVTRSARRIETSTLSDAALQKLLGEFSAAVEAGDARMQQELAQRLSLGLRLKAWGIARALYVVPSGATHFLPWGALEIEVPVAVLPMGGWLLRSPPLLAASGKAAVVGDPDFSGLLAALPGARAEAETVARQYGVTPLLGKAATEAALRQSIGGGVNTLHLATHGYFRAEAPLQSGVVLAGEVANEGKPHFLTAARLLEAPLPAQLVVLSACETGIGKAVAGDDFLGLSRSLYLGGARAVMASLWPVEDDPTQIFMQVFHQRLPRDGYGAAWLAARNRLRKDGLPPSAYGAFVLGGALR
jgi:CHAT domain-containing protein